MSREHVFSQAQYEWDMRIIDLLRKGDLDEYRRLLPQFMQETFAEVKAGSLTWMLAAMDYPKILGKTPRLRKRDWNWKCSDGVGYEQTGTSMTSKLYGAWVPGMPHLLKPELNQGYALLNHAAVEVGKEFQKLGVKRILYYSTQWLSVLGHSVQARPRVSGLHVDENWYELGDLPFSFEIDSALAKGVQASIESGDFQVRSVNYEGFPIDTGTIVADALVNPAKVPVGMFSCCVYSDYSETVKLGKLVRRSLNSLEGPSAVVVVSGLSGRYFTTEIDYREDHIREEADDRLNRRFLELASLGQWQEISSMRESYCKSAKADMGLKALAFLEGVGLAEGRSVLRNRGYAPIYGTGAAVLSQTV